MTEGREAPSTPNPVEHSVCQRLKVRLLLPTWPDRSGWWTVVRGRETPRAARRCLTAAAAQLDENAAFKSLPGVGWARGKTFLHCADHLPGQPPDWPPPPFPFPCNPLRPARVTTSMVWGMWCCLQTASHLCGDTTRGHLSHWTLPSGTPPGSAKLFLAQPTAYHVAFSSRTMGGPQPLGQSSLYSSPGIQSS